MTNMSATDNTETFSLFYSPRDGTRGLGACKQAFHRQAASQPYIEVLSLEFR